MHSFKTIFLGETMVNGDAGMAFHTRGNTQKGLGALELVRTVVSPHDDPVEWRYSSVDKVFPIVPYDVVKTLGVKDVVVLLAFATARPPEMPVVRVACHHGLPGAVLLLDLDFSVVKRSRDNLRWAVCIEKKSRNASKVSTFVSTTL